MGGSDILSRGDNVAAAFSDSATQSAENAAWQPIVCVRRGRPYEPTIGEHQVVDVMRRKLSGA
jgi:hypothetical protein